MAHRLTCFDSTHPYQKCSTLNVLLHHVRAVRIRDVAGLVGLGVFFLAAAHFSIRYETELKALMEGAGFWGPVAYVCIGFAATVVAPISSTPLIPIASVLWGPFLAAVLSVIGWTLGAVVAFLIARRLGSQWVSRFAALNKLQRYGASIPEHNLFVTVLVLRIVLPVDLLSYAVGLFSTMRLSSYSLATLLGTLPFAFIFSYATQMPLWIQASIVFAALSVMAAGFYHLRGHATLHTTLDQEQQ